MTTATRFIQSFLLPAIIIILISSVSSASIFMGSDDRYIKQGEIIEDDIYLFSNYMEVRGDVEGDVSAFIYDFTSSGNISGNLNLFAYDADIRGTIEQTARIFVNNGIVDASVGKNLILIGSSARIQPDTYVGKDLTFAGDRIVMAGKIVGNADLYGNTVVVKGVIDGNLEIKARDINIISPAHIKGSLTYTSQTEINIDEGVTIDGEVIWNEPEIDPADEDEDSVFNYLSSFALFLLSLTTGLALILVFKRHTRESSAELCRKPAMTFAIGLLSLAVSIVGSIVMFALIIGIPISLIMASVGITLMYLGKIYTSIALGRLIFKPFSEKRMPLGIELLLGLIILTILFQLPFIGWPIYIIVAIIGTGAAISGFMILYRKLESIDPAAGNPPPVI